MLCVCVCLEENFLENGSSGSKGMFVVATDCAKFCCAVSSPLPSASVALPKVLTLADILSACADVLSAFAVV